MPTIKPTFTKRIPKIPSNSRKTRVKIYASPIWQKLRQEYLSDNPLCQLCLKEGRLSNGDHIHHIISPFSSNHPEQLAFDYDNLLTLCENCHGRIHGEKKEATLHYIYYDRKNSKD